MHQSPNRAKQINADAALFDQAVADSRSVRAASLINDNAKSMNLMRGGVDPELRRARQAISETVEDVRFSVDQQSAELTHQTHRAILLTWLVIGFGLLTSFATAFYIVQSEVVQELLSLRDSIQDLAAGKLDQAIPFLDRNNEIGEISRALRTLQRGAHEREIQGWVKSEVASALTQLQAVEDFEAFAKTYCQACRNPCRLFTAPSTSLTRVKCDSFGSVRLQSMRREAPASLRSVRDLWGKLRLNGDRWRSSLAIMSELPPGWEK